MKMGSLMKLAEMPKNLIRHVNDNLLAYLNSRNYQSYKYYRESNSNYEKGFFKTTTLAKNSAKI